MEVGTSIRGTHMMFFKEGSRKLPRDTSTDSPVSRFWSHGHMQLQGRPTVFSEAQFKSLFCGWRGAWVLRDT